MTPTVLQPAQRRVKQERRLLWVGDAGCDSGFDVCTRNTLNNGLSQAFLTRVIGLNYRGDGYDHEKYPYDIKPAWVPGGDAFGVRRIVEQCVEFQPDVVVIQQDAWNIPAYVDELKRLSRMPTLVGTIAVDGLNCRGWALNDLDHVLFWTEFGRREAIEGGLTKPSSVVPLGVDLNVFQPHDMIEARKELGIHDVVGDDGFVFVNINRNQPRKRLDLTIQAFSALVEKYPNEKLYLYLHVCPTGDVGVDVPQLVKYFGIKSRVYYADPDVYHGVPEKMVARTYQAANALVSTTVGEGWGLTTMEAMACRKACALPLWSALEDWAGDVALMVPCSGITVTPKVNTIGGVVDHHKMVDAMETLFTNETVREDVAERSYARVREDRYRWENIGRSFLDHVEVAHHRKLLGL